jgi:flagellar biosynthesis GTPase FlhF
MELKRIIAKDTRTANEKAMALYGSDVLIISSCQVRGQTELIVAVDIDPIAAEVAVKEEFIPSDLTYSTKRKPGQVDEDENTFVPAHQKLLNKKPKSFDEVLDQTLKQNKRIERTASPATHAQPQHQAAHHEEAAAKAKRVEFVGPPKPADWRKPSATKVVQKSAAKKSFTHSTPVEELSAMERARDDREVLRGREIVELVREELATLRKEFKLSQQLAMWQGTPLSRNLQPLRNALNEAPIPAALRALLIDSIQSFDEVEPALQEIKRQLCSSIESSSVGTTVQVPSEGVHVLAGPSGSGKTLMIARLAQEISATIGTDQIAVISYSDLRAGAWNQAQLLSAQSGVDCFRANNPATLKLLLEEHSNRKIVFIDTPGVQMAERVAEIQGVCAQAQFHAVLPADVSLTTLRRIFSVQNIEWQSLMISKLDESSQPWPLIQCLTEGHVNVSVASKGERLGDWIRQVKSEDLVNLALSNLSLSHNDVLKDDSHQPMDMVRIARLASQLTGSKHE